LYPVGSILMTSRATIGAFALAQKPMAVNQGFIVVQPHDVELRLWIFHEMRSRVDEFVSLANGATFLELSRSNFKKFKVRLTEASIMREFAALAEPLHAVAANALAETAKLAATRDALLPQLMSGKLQVKDAEKVLEDAGV
jgi:type I restriction enzyme S subunit